MMRVKFFAPRWGYEHEDFGAHCARLVEAGYDGMELNLAVDAGDARRQLDLLEEHGLECLAQHSGTITSDFEEHKVHYCDSMERIAAFKPLKINSHSGRDYFTFEQNLELIDIAAEISERFGVAVVHETHRGRFPYSASLTNAYLQQRPGLRLTADFSHWCCVSESFLEDQEEFVEAAIDRADHIHSRVGFDQGPQVNDPRAPEWNDTVHLFLGWWDRIVETHSQEGSEMLTITTEFGPAPYTPVVPYTQEPVADQWELNLYSLHLLKERYSSRMVSGCQRAG
jgi:sugar phosphate isomerase/epimerase